MNTRRFCCLAGLLFVTCLWGVPWAGGGQKSQSVGASYYEQTLREKHIEPTANGLRQYFRSLHPDEAQRKQAAQRIRDMGSPESFAKREAAMAQLLVLPRPPAEQLTAAAAGPDPEIRWRAKQVLQIATVESERVFYAVLRTVQEKMVQANMAQDKNVQEKTLPGLAAELLRAMPLCDKPHLISAVDEALQASARAEDALALRQALRSASADVRMVAAGALGRALGAKAADELQALTQDREDKVKVAAARALANLGDRRSLAALLRLLSADDVNVRVTATVTLQALTGKHFGYAAYDTPENRERGIARWKAWVEEEGRTAKLTYPLKPFGAGANSHLNGNTLLAFGFTVRVAEYDPSEREVWSYDVPGAWSAEKMSSGNVLIASHNNKVIQVDPAKKIVWEYACSTPRKARALTNGNILIPDYGAQRVVEVAPDKKVVWTYACGGSPTDAHRLESGNTLVSVAEGGGVREVTPEGKTVWDYSVRNAYGCQPLPSGNVLIADYSGQVLEVARDKKVVWQFDFAAVDCFRLPNGNTLITGHLHFLEVTPDKRTIWSKTFYGYGSARR